LPKTALSSASRVVRAPGVPFQLLVGRKRTFELAARKRADESESPVVGMSFQVEDPVACHCHLPWADVAALAVMATPPMEPESMLSSKLPEKRLATVSPAGLVVSSATAGRVAAPDARGASFLARTVTLRDWARLSAPPLAVPPESWTVQVKCAAP